MYIAIWLMIGIVVQIINTSISVFVLGNNLNGCFDTFKVGVVTVMTLIVGPAINIVIWPVSIVCEIIYLKKSI